MPAHYFIDIANTNIYLDGRRRRCAAPGGRASGAQQTIYFVKQEEGALLTSAKWDDALIGFTLAQRIAANLWAKDDFYRSGP